MLALHAIDQIEDEVLENGKIPTLKNKRVLIAYMKIW